MISDETIVQSMPNDSTDVLNNPTLSSFNLEGKNKMNMAVSHSNNFTFSIGNLPEASTSTDLWISKNDLCVSDPILDPYEVLPDFLLNGRHDILKTVTKFVNGFNPFTLGVNPCRFVPILEARGGTDKDAQGHRKDSLPIANALASQNCQTCIFQYLEEDQQYENNAADINDALGRFLGMTSHGVIVRINPGTLSVTTQNKVDSLLRDLDSKGIKIMNHPDVNRKLGAKDALVKIKNMNCGLADTEVYYDAESFKEGFRKSIAFKPRVIKQNRGSQGEGIWICKLKDENAYNKRYGESTAPLDTDLILVEANDNHVEHHTVGEFLEWCINGRTEQSGQWFSSGSGKYFEGGVDSGAMLVDQRFLPRIVEGEIRCLMVGSELIEIVHKKPKAGGVSATLQSGATYTKYTPDDVKFKTLVSNFKKDLPNLMAAFGFSNQPLPLIWSADYILGDGDDEFYLGEMNCTCVGVTQQLDKVDRIATVAIKTTFPSI